MTYEKIMDFEGAHTEASNSHTRGNVTALFSQTGLFLNTF